MTAPPSIENGRIAGCRLLTPAQAARLFRVDPHTVRNWSDAGLLAVAARTAGGHRRYREPEIRALLNGPTTTQGGRP